MSYAAVRSVGGEEIAGVDDPRNPVSTSRSTARTPSARPSLVISSTPTTSVPSATRTPANERTWSSKTGSRWSWGTHAGAVGLISALCSVVG
jgi:hypothetical protein